MTLRKTVSRCRAEIVKILPVLSRDFSLVKGPAVRGLVQYGMIEFGPTEPLGSSDERKGVQETGEFDCRITDATRSESLNSHQL